MSNFSNCPPEILDQVIGHVEAWRYDHTNLPQAPLIPLLNVCKAWKPVAERLLYQTISIGSDFRSTVIPGTERTFDAQKRRLSGIAHELLQTLQRSPRLASLVRHLRLIAQDVHIHTLSQDYVQILRLCENVDSVQLYGFHPDEARSFVDVLREKSLISFTVSGRGRSGWERGPLCPTLELLEMMANWPNLQCVQLYNAALCTPNDMLPVNLHPKACLQLLTIEIPGGPEISGPHLRALLSMCPFGVRKLHIRVSKNSDTVAALCECLCAWSSSLIDLRVTFPRAVPNTSTLSSAISMLTNLRRLHLLPVMYPASCLADMSQLVELFYYSRRAGIDDLLQEISDQRKLPSLRILNCMIPFDGLDLYVPNKYAEAMCRTRNTTVTIVSSRPIIRRPTPFLH